MYGFIMVLHDRILPFVFHGYKLSGVMETRLKFILATNNDIESYCNSYFGKIILEQILTCQIYLHSKWSKYEL